MEELTLLKEAKAAGLEVWAEGAQLVIRGPKAAESVAQRLLADKAAILSALVLPEEARAVVSWAAWLAEWVPSEEVEIRFYEAPLRPVCLRLADLGKYVTCKLGSLRLLESSEVVSAPELRPSWRVERIREVCSSLEALREALRPLGLAELKQDAP